MSYTLDQGVETSSGMNRIQRGLLIGLPALAVLLSFGAIRHQQAVNPGDNAKTIPIVSSLTTAGDSNKGASSSGDNGTAANTSAPAAASSNLNSAGTVSPITTGGGTVATYSGGTSGGVVGGMGGGPTGGTTGNGGSVTIPDCSLDQIATTTCRVPACSPEVTLSTGQKAILGVGGTCIVVN